MTNEQDPRFQELNRVLTTAIMLATNPRTEVDDRTKYRLQEPIRVVNNIRSNRGTPAEIRAGIHGLLNASGVLAAPDAMFLEPLRKALEEYEAG